MRVTWRIVAIWACFVARVVFYCAMLPLWEGYDEWAHFAVLRAMAAQGELLVSRDRPVPRDVEESLGMAPVPWELRTLPPPSVTQDAFWGLGADERQQREQALRRMPAAWRSQDGVALTTYEALQPPLYYWMLAPVLRLMSGAALATQVVVLRWLSGLMASVAIPLVFFVAREVFEEPVALGCAAIVALMPGFAMDVARIGNDALAVVLFSGLTWAILRAARAGVPVLLGFGLLTKVYFLTAAPAAVARLRRRWWIAPAAAFAMAGWWYVRNLVTTGTLSGLSESVILRNIGVVEMIRRIPAVPWLTAVDAILFSHLYFGGWSSLMVRSWMYHVFYVLAALAAVGLIWQWKNEAVRWLLAVYGLFWIGQLYNVLLLYLSKGLPGSMGWYMYAVVAAEVVLCVAGFGRFRRGAAAGGAILFGLFDLYTVHAVAIPYYTGMIHHKPNAALAALHAADFRAVGFAGAWERLAVNKAPLLSEPLLIALWVAYLAATAWLILDSLREAAKGSIAKARRAGQ